MSEGACPHDIIHFGICTKCGDIVDVSEGGIAITAKGGGQIHLSQAETALQRTVQTKRLQEMKKLCLVLDLDHTLLEAKKAEQAAINSLGKDIMHVSFVSLKPGGQTYLMKFRPGVEKFLEEASKIAELNVYTHGSRAYAEAACKVLDPSGDLFNNRIVTRCDIPVELCPDYASAGRCERGVSCPYMHASSIEEASTMPKCLSRLFPLDESMILVLDDRIDVWTSPRNVVLIKPYHYFETLRPVEAPMCSALQRTLEILQGVHADFFFPGGVRDVRELLQRRRTFLEGLVITFSGVFPTGLPFPERQWLWAASLAAGATVLPDFSPKCTHLVMPQPRMTSKLKQALETGTTIATVHWLAECLVKWKLLPVEKIEGLCRPSKQSEEPPRKRARVESGNDFLMDEIEALCADGGLESSSESDNA